MKTGNRHHGYAFLIVAIAIFVVAMLGITVLADFAIKTQQRETDTTRLAAVYRAIVGNPATESFGYLGDVGAYPTTFQDLIVGPTGATGWNGPYLSESLFNGSIVNDPYGSPMEYDLNLVPGSTDELAVISKGPDHTSSNAASNPNDETQFTGSRPSSGSTYTSASGNGDNLAYPDYSVSPSTALQYNPTGTLAYNIVNKDLSQNNTLVPACPMEYNIIATSHSRGSADTIKLPWTPGLADNFVQGLWDISITSVQAVSSYFSESVAIYSGRTVSHTIYVEDINTQNTTAYALNVTNNTGKNLDIYDFKNNALNSVKNNVGAGTTNVGNVPACSSITAKDHANPNPILGTWYTPWGMASTHVISSARSALTITNANAGNVASHRMIQVYGNGLPLGTVYQRQTSVFGNVDSGAPVVITDQTGLTQLGNFSMPGAGTSLTF